MAKDRIETELRADSTHLRAEFSKAQAKVRKFTKGVKTAATSLGGLAAGAIGLKAGFSIFGEILTKFDRVGKLANRFDLPAEVVQKLAIAAELSGSSLEKLVAALTKATVAGVEAGQGLETYRRAFGELNIDVAEFNKASADQKLTILAHAFNEATDASGSFTAAYRILGKSGADLIPLLRENADGIARLSEHMKAMSDEDVQAIQDFNDGMALLRANLQAELGSAFAKDLEGAQEAIEAIGETMVSAVQFAVKYREAIEKVVLGIAAYKGIKVAVTVGREAIMIAKATTAMIAKTAATSAETAAVGANTAAHLTNARARRGRGNVGGKTGRLIDAAMQKAFLLPEGQLKSSGKESGKLFGKAMGKVAAANASLAMAGGIGGSVAIVAASAAIGYAAGNAIAEAMGKAADEKFRKITKPLHDVLSITHQLVNEARTQQETDDARLRIKREIKRLTETELANATGQKRAEIEYTIEVLKRRDASANMLRERNLQRDTEARIGKELAIQRQNALYIQKVNEEAFALAQKRLQKERQIAAAMREQIGKTRQDVVNTQIDLMPSEKRVKIFTDRLKQQMKDAEFSFNALRKPADRIQVEGMGDVFRAAQKAQDEGNLNLANALLGRLRKMQKTQAQLTRAKEETLQKQRDQKSEAQELNGFLDDQLQREKELVKQMHEKRNRQNENKRAIAGELAVLRLKAQGRREESEELQKAIEIRKVAQRIAEQTGVSENKALEIARLKAGLQKQTNRLQERSGKPDEGLRERLRRERAERIEAQKKKNRIQAQRDPNRSRLGLRGKALRGRQAARERRRVGQPLNTIEDRLSRVIDQQDDLLNVWKNIVTSS